MVGEEASAIRAAHSAPYRSPKRSQTQRLGKVGELLELPQHKRLFHETWQARIKFGTFVIVVFRNPSLFLCMASRQLMRCGKRRPAHLFELLDEKDEELQRNQPQVWKWLGHGSAVRQRTHQCSFLRRGWQQMHVPSIG